MSDFDVVTFAQKIKSFSDEELIAFVTINAGDYVSEAIDIAMREVNDRGLSKDLQNVHFDVFLNHSGFAGRLILLDEQILYLSTGMKGSPGGGHGLVGAIAGEAYYAERYVAAKKMNFSALDNDGSWIFYLDEIIKCETNTSMLSGKELILEAREEDGSNTRRVIKCNDLSKEEFFDMATKITDAKSNFENNQDGSQNPDIE
ncbi:MAG: hypothetical protein ACREO5_02690 [Candidatus Binatia bacterium]